jgi:hypothetical protein
MLVEFKSSDDIKLNNHRLVRTKFGELFFNVSKFWYKNVTFLPNNKKLYVH